MTGEIVPYEPPNEEEEDEEEVEGEQADGDEAEGDASTRGSSVGNGHADHTIEFTTNKIFSSKSEMISWVRGEGLRNNTVLIIRRSDSGGVGKRIKRPRVVFGCERHGTHKPSKAITTTNQASEVESRKDKRVRLDFSKKCGCPFLLRGVNIGDGDGDEWKLEVVCGSHNHTAMRFHEGHSFAGRLSKEETELMMDMSKNLIRPKNILTSIKDRNVENASTIKTIYNARHRYRTKDKAGRTQMQQLLHRLSEHKYVEFHRCYGPDDTVSDIFWTHPINVQMVRSFPHVLIMDCTYKTNRYRYPLLEIVGVTSTEMTFSVAFVYLNSEKEDNYTWALSRLRDLLNDDCLPGVIVTDRELALKNAISTVFPSARHLLCRWHISKAVLANCKRYFGTKGEWEKFNNAWHNVVNSSTEEEYLSSVHDIASKYRDDPEAIKYLNDVWLNDHKEMFVAAWTDTCLHFGTTTSNRVESAHARLKRQLGSSQLSFDISWAHIHSLIMLQDTEIKASFEKSRCFIQSDFRHPDLRELVGVVSIAALNKIVIEMRRAKSVEGDVLPCLCTIRHTHGLPCKHEIADYRRLNQAIPLGSIHLFWTKLDYDYVPKESNRPTPPFKAHMEEWQNWYEQQDDEMKRVLMVKLEELKNPSSSMLTEPIEKLKTRGRPRKIDTSTRRMPSHYEYVLAASQGDSHSPTTTQTDATTLSKAKPKKRPLKKKTYKSRSDSPSMPAVPSQMFISEFPESFRPYIDHVIDVDSDGHCGYRAVAHALGFGTDAWRKVRWDLLTHLRDYPNLFKIVYQGDDLYDGLTKRLDHFEDSAYSPHWMIMPEMGHLIATTYKVVVVLVAKRQCLTFLPLHLKPTGLGSQLKEIAIGFLDSMHFIQLNMTPRHPLPPIATWWTKLAHPDARHLGDIYAARVAKFKELPGLEDVATRETIRLDDV